MPIDPETQLIYDRVAKEFAARIERHFESEESLQKLYAKYFTALPFDRTAHWNTVLSRELKEAWKVGGFAGANPTTFDERAILRALSGLLDYNLFTQVYLNLQPAGLLAYGNTDAVKTLEGLQAKWAGKSPSPFDAKPKMFKNAAKQEEVAYNYDLSEIKALKIISGLTNARSFRVSPKGVTPALTDSENLSMLGVGGDNYLLKYPGFRAIYYTRDAAPDFLEVDTKSPTEPKFRSPFIKYPFTSKSGGDILRAALFARMVAYRAYLNQPEDATFVILPRMTSVLVVTNAEPSTTFTINQPGLIVPDADIRVCEGQRPSTPLTSA